MAIVCPQTNNISAYLDVLAFIEENKNIKAKNILQKYTCFKELLDITDKTLLHISAKCGNSTITQFLVESGSNVNAQDINGKTPLMLVPTRAASTAKILLDANACMHIIDANGTSALKKLVKNCRAEWNSLQDNRDILRVFYEKLKCNNVNNKLTIAKKLREADCPLPVVVLLNDNELTKHMLVEIGCALDERAHGLTALHLAVQTADLNNVKVLLEYGADVNGVDRNEETPLCKYRMDTEDSVENSAILRLLLRRGASLNAMVSKGFGYREVIAKRLLAHGQRETIFALLENMDLTVKYGSSEQTALHFLAQNENRAAEDGIRLVLTSEKIDVNSRDKKGRTALTIAVTKGLTSRVEFLVANGAKASLLDIVEKTPMIRQLTKKSARFSESEDDSTQKHYAKVLKLLLRYEIDFQSAPEKWQCDKNVILIKLTLAYVVIAENDDEDGRPLSASIRTFIKSRQIFRDHYNLCKKQLEEIKSVTIHGSVTIYKLLTENEEKLVNYVCNRNLVLDFHGFMRTKIPRDSYYRYILQRRVDKAVRIAMIRELGASAICKITGFPANEHRHIVLKIVDYLNPRDFQILLRATEFI